MRLATALLLALVAASISGCYSTKGISSSKKPSPTLSDVSGDSTTVPTEFALASGSSSFCSLFGSCPPPSEKLPPVVALPTELARSFDIVAHPPDVAAYPSGREHTLVIPPPDRSFVFVRVMNYPRQRPLALPTFAPASPASPPPSPATQPSKPSVRSRVEVYETTVQFPSDVSKLTPDARAKLDSFLNTLSDQLPSAEVSIHANTDSVGSSDFNKRLSVKRAFAVRDYIVTKGAKPSHVSLEASGEENPVATNETEQGRAKNRRADLLVKPRKD